MFYERGPRDNSSGPDANVLRKCLLTGKLSGRAIYKECGSTNWRYTDDNSMVPDVDKVGVEGPVDVSVKGRDVYYDGDNWIYEDDGTHVPEMMAANLPTAPALEEGQ